MPRTCNLSYRINGGTLTDISTHGFHLVKSDDRITAPIKPYEEQKSHFCLGNPLLLKIQTNKENTINTGTY